MITTKYVMTGSGIFAIVSKMTGMEHTHLCRLGLDISPEKLAKEGGSAGFLNLNDDGSLTAYGRSLSCDLPAREGDGEKITAAIRDGKVRLESIVGREEDFIAGNIEGLQAPDLEVATLANLKKYKVIG
jgi:hypothetical protein